jgi:protein-tyrosine phosphatase
MSLPPDPDCYWVEPGRLVAGEYPGHWHEHGARKKIRALLEAGVRTFLDLTEDGELAPYDEFLGREARAQGIDVTYYRHPIRDLSVPTPEGMRSILGLIDDAIANDAPVYVHCWGGIGRTGTVVCCWLVERGRTGAEALAEIVLLREGIRKRLIASPEAEEQRVFVEGWTRTG